MYFVYWLGPHHIFIPSWYHSTIIVITSYYRALYHRYVGKKIFCEEWALNYLYKHDIPKNGILHQFPVMRTRLLIHSIDSDIQK